MITLLSLEGAMIDFFSTSRVYVVKRRNSTDKSLCTFHKTHLPQQVASLDEIIVPVDGPRQVIVAGVVDCSIRKERFPLWSPSERCSLVDQLDSRVSPIRFASRVPD